MDEKQLFEFLNGKSKIYRSQNLVEENRKKVLS